MPPINSHQIYQANSAPQPKPFHHTDLKNTLEGIVFKELIDKGKGSLENIFSDKTKTLKATVKALLEEIKLRETLDSHLLKKIDEEICQQHTHIMQLGNQKTYYQFERFMEVKSLKMKMEDNVLELEKEKRKEYLECWRDLMFLKKYLMVALKDYWEFVKKREVLNNMNTGISEKQNFTNQDFWRNQ